MPYDSTEDTLAHIEKVQDNMQSVGVRLIQRALDHDASKLQSPEKEAFDVLTPRLKGLTYGSDEYKASLAELKPALDHHYAKNSHHPEHEESIEEWRDVVDYEGWYQVSNLGRIRSVERVIPRDGPTGKLTRKEMVRSAHMTPQGYLRLQLAKNGATQNHLVHVLVAKAFLGIPPSDQHQVNHKSGVKSNNRVANLEWVTPGENLQEAYDTGLRKPSVKHVYVCEELGLATLGADKMADDCHKLGHLKVCPPGVWKSAMNGGCHAGLSFSAFPLAGEMPYSGIEAMSLLDVIEMLCDWKAAGERHADGSMERSLTVNQGRFAISPQLQSILVNTAKELGWL